MCIIRPKKQQKINESFGRNSFLSSARMYAQFSWAAISMVTSPLVKAAKKKIKWSGLAGWRQTEERQGKRWRDNHGVVGEKKRREGVCRPER